jgi:hypothetical protein
LTVRCSGTELRFASYTRRPPKRKLLLDIGRNALVGPTNNSSVLTQWGIALGKELMEIDARQLKAPVIHYGQK